ncbi:hypothetical protein ACQPW1_00315 [Nocardia sp. CA-128927]|uniref:hypothetical protein n=1 Tax=Nocardia sp. CA-128927 TaxID=3239975 RepID=UPI003D96923A
MSDDATEIFASIDADDYRLRVVDNDDRTATFYAERLDDGDFMASDLTPAQARELIDALTRWVDRN